MKWRNLIVVSSLILMVACSSDERLGSKTGSPVDELPAWITPLIAGNATRADWSGDSRRLLFLDALVGDVFEYALEDGSVTPLTAHFEHAGFTRARYLANGDILLCGPRAAVAKGEDGGRWNPEFWLLQPRTGKPATALNEPCFEGPAVSRSGMRIAWTVSDYPDSVIFGRSEIWIGDIVYDDDVPTLVNRQLLIDRSVFNYLAFLETQDFRPPDDRELIITAYGYKGGEVITVNIETGTWINHSQNWAYDEAEGVAHDGSFVLVEREPATYTAVPKGDIDIWRLKLDGSGAYTRLTHFTDYAGFGASNPVVSPDGRYMAFQLRLKSGDHGNGAGIFLYDLEAAPY